MELIAASSNQVLIFEQAEKSLGQKSKRKIPNLPFIMLENAVALATHQVLLDLISHIEFLAYKHAENMSGI